MEISAIHLVRFGNDVVLRIEHEGQWVEVIREQHDGMFSHIVEESGMQVRTACG